MCLSKPLYPRDIENKNITSLLTSHCYHRTEINNLLWKCSSLFIIIRTIITSHHRNKNTRHNLWSQLRALISFSRVYTKLELETTKITKAIYAGKQASETQNTYSRPKFPVSFSNPNGRPSMYAYVCIEMIFPALPTIGYSRMFTAFMPRYHCRTLQRTHNGRKSFLKIKI